MLGLLFNLIFLYDKGMINQILEVLGMTKLIDWKDQGHALMTMMLPVMWQYVGFYFIILVTGLNGIDDDPIILEGLKKVLSGQNGTVRLLKQLLMNRKDLRSFKDKSQTFFFRIFVWYV